MILLFVCTHRAEQARPDLHDHALRADGGDEPSSVGRRALGERLRRDDVNDAVGVRELEGEDGAGGRVFREVEGGNEGVRGLEGVGPGGAKGEAGGEAAEGRKEPRHMVESGRGRVLGRGRHGCWAWSGRPGVCVSCGQFINFTLDGKMPSTSLSVGSLGWP